MKFQKVISVFSAFVFGISLGTPIFVSHAQDTDVMPISRSLGWSDPINAACYLHHFQGISLKYAEIIFNDGVISLSEAEALGIRVKALGEMNTNGDKIISAQEYAIYIGGHNGKTNLERLKCFRDPLLTRLREITKREITK